MVNCMGEFGSHAERASSQQMVSPLRVKGKHAGE